MNTVDIVLLACFIPALIRGLSKGLTDQLIGIIALIAAAYLAFHFTAPVAALITPRLGSLDSRLINILSFGAIIVVVVVVLRLIGWAISTLLKEASLGWLNRLGGFFFSIFKTALILGLLLSLLEGFNEKVQFMKPELLNESFVYHAVRNFSDKVFPFLKELVTNA